MRLTCLSLKAAGAFALAVFSCLGAGDAAAQDARPLDIARDLPGYWGIDPDETPPHLFGPGSETCDTLPVRIWLSEEGDRYNSQYAGEGLFGTSPILQRLPASEYGTGILIAYENLEQLDPYGEQIRWWLVMTDRNHFQWYRLDSDGQRYEGRALERCPDAAVS